MINKEEKSFINKVIDGGKSVSAYMLKGMAFILPFTGSYVNSTFFPQKQDNCMITPDIKNNSIGVNGGLNCLRTYQQSNFRGSPFVPYFCDISVFEKYTPDDCVNATIDFGLECNKAGCRGNDENNYTHIECDQNFKFLFSIEIPPVTKTKRIKFDVPENVKDNQCCYDKGQYQKCCDKTYSGDCVDSYSIGIFGGAQCLRKDKTVYFPSIKTECHRYDDRGIMNDFGVKYPQKQQAPKRNSMFHEKHELKGGHPPISNSDDSSNIPRNKRHK